MNHQEKQRIFDEYAIENGYDNFIEIISDYITLKKSEDILQHAFAACDLVQEEQQKRIADNARTNSKITAYGLTSDVNKNSIITPENIIK